jgi:hypothetical protein
MFGQGKRAAILELHRQGHSVRKIARTLRASRNTVRRIIDSGTTEVPKIVRSNKAEGYRYRFSSFIRAAAETWCACIRS